MRRRILFGSAHFRRSTLAMMLGGLAAAAIAAACGSGTSERLSSGGLPEMGGGMATDDAATAAVDAAVYGDGVNRTIAAGSPQRWRSAEALERSCEDARTAIARAHGEYNVAHAAGAGGRADRCRDRHDGGLGHRWHADGHGLHASSCGDAGIVTNPYNTPTVCTSNKTWNNGNEGSSAMRPGGACITCHTMRGGPAYTIAGSVYPTAHEPNDCNGLNGAVTVVVTDANGVVTNVTTNSVGNFFSRADIVAPFRVKLVNGAKVGAMAGALTAGDCNSCLTLAGVNGAPGRVMAP